MSINSRPSRSSTTLGSVAPSWCPWPPRSIQLLRRQVLPSSRETNEQASSMSFQGVKDRTRGLFERIARADDSTGGLRMTPALTHQQIADMVGTSRETVTRAIKQLKTDGWLGQEGKRYVIPDGP